MHSEYYEVKKRNKRIQIKQEKIRKIKELLNNDNYFNWLNEFTNTMTIFLEGIDYDISKEDNDNIKLVDVLFDLVNRYAKNNNIKLTAFKNGTYYVIQNSNIYYQIGVVILNNHVGYFISRCDKETNKKIINIDNIREEYSNQKLKRIEELKILKNQVINLVENDIKTDEILNYVNEGIEEGQTKKYIKLLKENTD